MSLTLFQSIEAIALKAGTLTAGMLIANRTGIRDMILGGASNSEMIETLKYSAYLSGVEIATDFTARHVLGMRALNLHTDSTFGAITTFATNYAVYYVLEMTNLLDVVLDNIGGDNEIQRTFVNAAIYSLVQEISYRVLTYMFRTTASNYGSKFNF